MHWRQNSTYRDDAEFIANITARMNQRLSIINDYSVYWSECYKLEPEPHKKENYATRQANVRIRKMVKQAMMGEQIETVTPPVICGNCEHLTIDNFCTRFKQTVPTEFINQENECEQYKNGVPF